MSDQTRLSRLSETLCWTAPVLSALLPLLVLLHAARGVMDPATLLSFVPRLGTETPDSRAQAGLVAAVALVSVLPVVAALRAKLRPDPPLAGTAQDVADQP
jgi:hypothetical protein